MIPSELFTPLLIDLSISPVPKLWLLLQLLQQSFRDRRRCLKTYSYLHRSSAEWGYWVPSPWGHGVTTTLTHLPTATGRLPAHQFAIPPADLHHTLTLLLPTTTMDIPTLAELATPPMFIWAIVLPFKLHRLHHNIISLVDTGERSIYLLFLL